jgi:hypothetical protein
MGKPCRVTFGEKVFFKPDFVKRFLDTLHLEDDVVENSTYLKSIGYDNAFNEGDPMLIREKKAEAKAEAKEQAKEETSIFNDIDAAPKKGSKAAKIKHNNSLREKYGKDANVARAISSKFEAIAEELKAKGIFTKIEC